MHEMTEIAMMPGCVLDTSGAVVRTYASFARLFPCGGGVPAGFSQVLSVPGVPLPWQERGAAWSYLLWPWGGPSHCLLAVDGAQPGDDSVGEAGLLASASALTFAGQRATTAGAGAGGLAVVDPPCAPITVYGREAACSAGDVCLAVQLPHCIQFAGQAEHAALGGAERVLSGLSHDFGNALASIMGFAELGLGVCADAGTPMARSFSNVLRGCDRAMDVIAWAQAAAGRLELNRVVTDVAALVAQWCHELGLPAPQCDVSDATCLCDGVQLRRVFEAVVDNARRAAGDGGTIAIGIGPDGGQARRAQPMLAIWVRDTGAGMERHVLCCCCEPYYTTRDRLDGKGRGLALVAGLMRAHGGCVELASAPGQGTVVSLVLPLAAGVDTTAAAFAGGA